MYLQYIEANNYMGIYNGLGLNKLFIDFRKCKNTITVIKGDNGSGKSTLNSIISPLPDPSDFFIPGITGGKKVGYYDDKKGLTYDIEYISDDNGKGGRTNKGYFSVTNINTGIKEDLNPSGNITECKELVFDRFRLDANFLALSQLSCEDRGLVDKKPSERKRFVNAIIENLSVYNNIYKTLSKRSSTFKAMINSLSSKIDNLGDADMLKKTSESVQDNIAYNTGIRDNLIADIAAKTAQINSIDQSILEEDKELNAKRDMTMLRIKDETETLTKLLNKMNMDKQSSKFYSMFQQQIEKSIEEYKRIIATDKAIIESLISAKEEDARVLAEKNIKLQSLSDDDNYTKIKSLIDDNTASLHNISKLFDELGFEQYANISRTEYDIVVNALKTIYSEMDYIRRQYTSGEIENAAERELEVKIGSIKFHIKELGFRVNEINIDIAKIETEKGISESLNKSDIDPKCLKNPKCIFKDLINGELGSVLIEKQKAKHELETEIKKFNEKLKSLEVAFDIQNRMETMMQKLLQIQPILSKFPNTSDFSDVRVFGYKFYNGDHFRRIDNINKYVEYSNMIDTYASIEKTINSLKEDLRKYTSKESLIAEILEDTTRLTKSLNDLTERINRKNQLIASSTEGMEKIIDHYNTIGTIHDHVLTIETLEEELKETDTKLKQISDSVIAYNTYKIDMARLMSQKREVENNINLLTEDRDNLNHAMKMLKEYMEELSKYQLNYDKIETIKYFSSPTTGIQTIFMELYMNKIISMGNELLSMVFNGEYVLYPFVINESEFRIPCKGKGIMNDDISSMSTSQRSMISMILSFALLYHSSTTYNILKLDEIDGGLDSINRVQFISLLNNLMNTLGCNQCVMISHNNELSLDNTDMIILKNTDPDFKPTGNIIYQY